STCGWADSSVRSGRARSRRAGGRAAMSRSGAQRRRSMGLRNRARWHASLLGWLLFMVPELATAQTSPKVHELMAAPDTVHRGFFDAPLKPVLTIDSGDVVRLHTASGNPRYYEALGVPKDKIPADLYRVFQGVEDALRWDHTLNGPIY